MVKPVRYKVIENTQDRNPAVYLCGKLLCSHQYKLEEMEFAKAMLGHCGVYEPQSISFTDHIGFETGDMLVLVYTNKRYEFTLKSMPHAGDKINLSPDPP